LHQKAGSKRVLEIHGSPAVHQCPSCGKTALFAKTAKTVREGGIPRCPACGDAMKPDIVFFGEALPERVYSEAVREARMADLMLVLGSSLVVYPAAGIPELTVESGGTLAIVNDQPTALDGRARLRFDDLGSVFAALEAAGL